MQRGAYGNISILKLVKLYNMKIKIYIRFKYLKMYDNISKQNILQSVYIINLGKNIGHDKFIRISRIATIF